jgi:hypothetical protein
VETLLAESRTHANPQGRLLRLVSYGSVEEVLPAFRKLAAESRGRLNAELGKADFALLGCPLIGKGYSLPDDAAFQN